MTDPKTVATLFEKEPARWGLRGDPFLWREMQVHFNQTPLPDTADELAALIEAVFALLTGHAITKDKPFFIERFSHGGMSSGLIAPDFWREKAIPLICSRLIET